MEPQVFTVRAMPAPGHERRWCAQRPFTKTPIDVIVKDDPAPHKMQDGKIVSYSYEMTPADLEQLRRDRHLAVSIKGNPDADPLELNATKARLQELEEKLAHAHRSHQADVEQMKAERAGAARVAADSGARAGQLEQEVASLRAQLSGRRDHQADVDEMKAELARAAKVVAESSARVGQLEEELATLRAQLANKKGK